ncbi:MAG: hypothetical protein ACLSHC_01365 [Bilophila wadsworthia]
MDEANDFARTKSSRQGKVVKSLRDGFKVDTVFLAPDPDPRKPSRGTSPSS